MLWSTESKAGADHHGRQHRKRGSRTTAFHRLGAAGAGRGRAGFSLVRVRRRGRSVASTGRGAAAARLAGAQAARNLPARPLLHSARTRRSGQAKPDHCRAKDSDE